MIEKTSKIILPLLFALGAGEAWATLSADVARMVREAGFRAGEAAIWVADVDTGYVEAAVNAGRPMEPASIMKVVTTAVAGSPGCGVADDDAVFSGLAAG